MSEVVENVETNVEEVAVAPKKGRKPAEKAEETTAEPKVVEKIVEKIVEVPVEKIVEVPVEKVVYRESPETQSEIANLKAKIEFMSQMLTSWSSAQQNAAGQVAASINNLNNEVKIVHLVQRAPGLSTYMKLSNLDVILTEFGEERYLTLQQFEEMLGKYRRWFDSGMVSLAAGYDDIARRYALKTAAEYPMNSEFVKNLGFLKMDEIEMMYDRLPESGKEFILSYWKRKIIEGDINFKDIRKIETLNRISNGEMEAVLAEIRRDKAKK